MKVVIVLSWIIQVILGVLILVNLAYGDPTPVSRVLSQGIHNAIIYMFLLLGTAAITYIYENNKKRVSES